MRWRSAIALGPLTFVLLVLSTAAHATPGTWTATGSLGSGRAQHTATLLLNGNVLVTGGCCYSSGISTELYNSSAGVWTSAGVLSDERTKHTATLLQSGKVLVAGGSRTDFPYTTHSTAELYDPVTGVWTATGSMTTRRYGHTATLLANGKVLVAGGCCGSRPALSFAELYDPVTGVWTVTGSMTTGRYSHTATLLPNGKVLVVGGYNTTALNSVELYDPSTGIWTATGGMNAARSLHTATLLPSGKVLVAGGASIAPLSSAELYDPVTGTWTATGSMNVGRQLHTAALLLNGKVLVAGAYDTTALNSAELYDPVTGVWTVTGFLSVERAGHTATLLPNGKVLVAGGFGVPGPTGAAELYDPDGTPPGLWIETGRMTTGRYYHTASVLPNGKVLIAGGYNTTALNSAELYDPVTGIWTATGSMNGARYGHTATLLPSGKVLVAAGLANSAELYDPSTGVWTATGSMNGQRVSHTATLLPSGKVLVAGGQGAAGIPSSAELYDPGTGTWTATGSMTTGRYSHTATLLPNGKVLVAGGSSPGTLAELYDPSTGIWTTTGSMNGARTNHTATLLPNGTVLVAGGFNNPPGWLSSAELYDPVTGVWTATGSMTTERYYHTATLLPNGTVLVAGGNNIAAGTISSAERYDSSTGVWTATGSMNGARNSHTATLLSTGKVLVTGGYGSLVYVNSAELYDASFPSAPAIVSANASTFTVGIAGSFTVTATGYPTPSLSVSGTLPPGVTFNVASGVLSGSPAAGSANTYNLIFTASNGVLPNATQNFTLTVNPAPAAVLTSPAPGATFTATSQLFSWTSVASANEYSLWAGSTVGGYDYFHTYCLCTSATATALPTDGSTVYVRLWSRTPADGYRFYDYTFTAVTYAVITSPVPGSTLTAASVPFSWTSVASATEYSLWAGSTLGGYDYFYTYCLCTSATVTGLPTNGSTIYVRMWTRTPAENWTFTDYLYNPLNYAVISSPAPGSTLSGASQAFTWTSAAAADTYSLWAGSTLGGSEYYNSYCLCTSTTVTGLPTDSSAVSVRMWTHTAADGWTFIDYTYIAAAAP